MKRLLALLLAMVMLLSLAACGDKKKEDDEDEKSSTTKLKLDLEETVIVDTDDFAITVTDAKMEDDYALILTVKLENKSDLDLTFDLETCSVCGLTDDALIYTDVAAGKKANEQLYIYTGTYERNDLKYLTDIVLGFEVFEAENYNDDAYFVALDPVHVYPYGEENASTFTLESKDSHQVLLDNEYVTVTAIGNHKDDWSYSVDYYVVNKCGYPIELSAQSTSVNDYMIDSWFGYSIQPNEAIMESLNFYDSDLESIGVEDVESVEFTLIVRDPSKWETLSEDILVYEP